jgi:hypothetical protein
MKVEEHTGMQEKKNPTTEIEIRDGDGDGDRPRDKR